MEHSIISTTIIIIKIVAPIKDGMYGPHQSTPPLVVEAHDHRGARQGGYWQVTVLVIMDDGQQIFPMMDQKEIVGIVTSFVHHGSRWSGRDRCKEIISLAYLVDIRKMSLAYFYGLMSSRSPHHHHPHCSLIVGVVLPAFVDQLLLLGILLLCF